MYSQSGSSSAQLPQNARPVHSVSRKSRVCSLRCFIDTCGPDSACSAVAVDSKSGIGASLVAEKPPSGWARSSSHCTVSGGTGFCIWRSRVMAAAVVGVVLVGKLSFTEIG